MSLCESSPVHRLLPCMRAVGVLAVLTWGWYIVALVRTQQFGFSSIVLVVPLLLVLPFAILPFLGLDWRRVLIGTTAILFVVITSVEAYATFEELRFQHAHAALKPDAGQVFQDRQWPFADHHLFYNPRTGQWGGGD